MLESGIEEYKLDVLNKLELEIRKNEEKNRETITNLNREKTELNVFNQKLEELNQNYNLQQNQMETCNMKNLLFS